MLVQSGLHRTPKTRETLANYRKGQQGFVGNTRMAIVEQLDFHTTGSICKITASHFKVKLPVTKVTW